MADSIVNLKSNAMLIRRHLTLFFFLSRLGPVMLIAYVLSLSVGIISVRLRSAVALHS